MIMAMLTYLLFPKKLRTTLENPTHFNTTENIIPFYIQLAVVAAPFETKALKRRFSNLEVRKNIPGYIRALSICSVFFILSSFAALLLFLAVVFVRKYFLGLT